MALYFDEYKNEDRITDDKSRGRRINKENILSEILMVRRYLDRLIEYLYQMELDDTPNKCGMDTSYKLISSFENDSDISDRINKIFKLSKELEYTLPI